MVTDHFYRNRSGSLTLALQRAVQNANEALYRENQQSVLAERQLASLACVVIRDEDVFIALVGRAVGFVVHSGHGERLGRAGTTSGDKPGALIGQDPEVGVDLFQRPRDGLVGLLLGTPQLDDLADGEMARALGEAPTTIPALIRALTRRSPSAKTFLALTIVFGNDPDSLPDETTRDVSRRAAAPARPPQRLALPGRRPNQTPEPDVARLESPAVLAPDVPNRVRPVRQPARDVAHRPQTEEALPYRPSQANGSLPNRELPRTPRSRPAAGPPPVPAVADRAIGSVRNRQSALARTEEPSGRRIHAPVEATADPDLEDWGSPESVRRRGVALPPNFLRSILIGGLLVGLFLAGYAAVRIPAELIRNGAIYADAIGKLNQAEQHEHDALAQNDPQIRRQLLDQAQQLAQQADAERPGSPAITAALARIRQEDQSAVATTLLPAAVHLVDLPTPGDEFAVTSNLLAVLDRTNSVVYLYLLNAEQTSAQAADPVLLRKGSHVGTATVGQIDQIAWQPGDSAHPLTLFALDRAGFLVAYKPTSGLSFLPPSDLVNWLDVTAMRIGDDGLYALAGQPPVLNRYSVQGASFDGPPTNYFAGVPTIDLSDAVSFTLASDLYLLHRSGQVQRFSAGQPADFAVLPPDLAPTQPAGLAVGTSSVFIGDPGRGRIVELSRQGVYERSLSDNQNAAAFADLRDLAVSPDGSSLFVLAGSTVFRYAIPPPAAGVQ
jgi:hypothetical protein